MWYSNYDCGGVVPDLSKDEPRRVQTTVEEFSRSMGRIQNMQNFCKKYGFACRALMGNEDPIKIGIEGISNLIIKNEFKRVGENAEDELYLIMRIYFNGEKILTGYFTPEEIIDISKLDKRLTIK